MSILSRILFSAVPMLLLFAAQAPATPAWDVPDPSFSIVSMPFIENEEPVLYVLPNGEGNYFSQARNFGTCEIVNATIEVTVRDYWGEPIANFPLQELWLGGGLQSCNFGSWPASDTNSLGVTSWYFPVRAGSTGFVEVLINGTPIMGPGTPLNLRVNSPDINGDGFVNISDVQAFSNFYFNSYDFSADFYPDGILNIADISLMARGLGATCSQ